MPLARDFLQTFGESSLAAERWVLTGAILTYARDNLHIAVEDFYESHINIEALHSQVETKLLSALDRAQADRDAWIEAMALHSTYVQLIFVFAALINLIQNGPVSKAHKKLAATLTPEDVVITFNWDTLMDRALAECTKWTLDQGYGFEPHLIYRNGWEKPSKCTENFGKSTVLKLHGSSNWITSYPIIDPDTKKLSLMQTASPNRVSIYECTLDPYSTYDGRYMPGYERYSYGYYPPNLVNQHARGMCSREYCSAHHGYREVLGQITVWSQAP